jgi:MFS family permease
MRNTYTTLWIWLFVCPLALDYKSAEETSSHIAQVLLALPTLAAGLTLALIAPRFTRGSGLRLAITAGVLLTVLGSLVAQLLQGNPFDNYLRVLLPFVLFLLGYLAACHPWPAERIAQFERAMFWAMTVSLVFSFVYGMAVGGGLDKVRFRIVSVTFLALQGVLLHEFVVAKRSTRFSLLLFVASVVIELLSVTRSLLVGTALLFMLATWLGATSTRQMFKALWRALMWCVLLGTLVAGMSMAVPGVAEHWTQRIFASKETASGRDPTTITRLAEMKDQYDQVTATAQTLLTGKGFGHIYRYSPDYLPDLAGQFSDKDFYAIREWAAGHNFWVYQLFAGGLLFGVGLPLGVLYALYRGARAFRSRHRLAPGTPYLPVMGRAILLLAALPATSIGGNPLGPRFSGLIFGLALGLLVAAHARLAAAPRPHRPSPSPQPAGNPRAQAGAGHPGAPRLRPMQAREPDRQLPAS